MAKKKFYAAGKRVISGVLAVGLISALLPGHTAVYAEGEIKQIFVSPTASGGDGSSGSPFNSIEKAMNAAKGIRDSMTSGSVEIVLKEGTYRVDGSLKITSDFSGNENVQMAIVGEPGKKAKITNSKQLPNDKFEKVSDQAVLEKIPADARNEIYCINLKAIGINDLGHRGKTDVNYENIEFFMGDDRFIPAKWPNNTPDCIGEYGRATFGDIVRKDDSSQKYAFKVDVEKDRLERWKTASDPTIFGNMELGYSTVHMDVKAIDSENQTITIGGKQLNFQAGPGYWVIENLIEELDYPGEYYLDRNSGILYVYPMGDIKTQDIEYSLSKNNAPDVTNAGEAVIEYAADDVYGNIRLENLYIENSVGAGIVHNWKAQNLTVKNCRIQNVFYGFYSSKSDGLRFEGNTVYNTISSGFSTGGGDRNTLTSGNVVVTNNHFHKLVQGTRCGWGISGVGIGGVFSHNLVHNTPHAAIAMGSNESIWEYNEIYDACQDNLDAGVMYNGRSWSSGYGVEIRYNYLHDNGNWNGHSTAGIYLDDQLSGITVHDNVLQRQTGGIAICGGRNNKVYNNIMIDGMPNSSSYVGHDARGYGTHGQNNYDQMVKSITSLPYDTGIWLEKYPEVKATLDDDNPNHPRGAYVVNNVGSNWSYGVDPNTDFAPEAMKLGTFENNQKIDRELSYTYNDRGIIEFTKHEEFSELGINFVDITAAGVSGGGNYDIPAPEARRRNLGQQVNLLEGKADEVKLEYPEKKIEAVDLLKNSMKLDVVGELTQSGSNYLLSGKAGYNADTFENFVLRFNYKFTDVADQTGNWVVYMRGLDTTGDCWTGNSSYNIWLKHDRVESQRWNPGNNMQALTTEVVWNPSGEWNSCEVVCMTAENGNVWTYVNINGHTVARYEDANAMRITRPGYIHFEANGGSTLEIAPYDASLNTAKDSFTDLNDLGEAIVKPGKNDNNAAADEETPIKIILDGKELVTDSAPYIKNGRTYVPVRSIFEKLSARVEWDEQTRSVKAFKDTNRLYMGIDEPYAVFNGVRLALDAPAEITGDRTMVGARFVSEVFECNVDWKADTRTVEIKSPGYVEPTEPDKKDDNKTKEDDGIKSSVKYDDAKSVMVYHKPVQEIYYDDNEPIKDGVLDKEKDLDKLIDQVKVEDDYYLRDGVANFKYKLTNQPDRKLNVVFLGGSITQKDGYRNLVCNWLKEQYGDRFNFVNAGYGGTGSAFGRDRFYYDVGVYDPDLVFVEFAVNDIGVKTNSVMRSMEAIVRQTLKLNSTTNIIFLYTFRPDTYETAAIERWTPSAKIQDYIADYYGLPSVFVGTEAAKNLAEGKALGKKSDMNEKNKDLPLYSEDGVHPNMTGSEKYFETIERFLNDLLINPDSKFTPYKYDDGVPYPYLFKDSGGDRVNFTLDKYIDGASLVKTDARKYPNAYKAIDNLYITDTVGEGVTFTFTGTQAGLTVLSGPDAGNLDVYVDGELVTTVDTWHVVFCLGVEAMRTVSTPILENGKHTVSFKVSEKITDKMGTIKTYSPQSAAAFEGKDDILNARKIIFQSGWVNGIMEQ